MGQSLLLIPLLASVRNLSQLALLRRKTHLGFQALVGKGPQGTSLFRQIPFLLDLVPRPLLYSSPIRPVSSVAKMPNRLGFQLASLYST